MEYTYFESPVGPLLLAGEGGAMRLIGFPAGRGCRAPEPGWVESEAPFAEAKRQLGEFFAGARRHFDLPLATEGTPFQLEVWRQLGRIPYGETITYGELARRVGNPKASRAVGAANARNPLPIVVPCHRVIGCGGRLTGFGGGLEVKQFLLELEQGRVGPASPAMQGTLPSL